MQQKIIIRISTINKQFMKTHIARIEFKSTQHTEFIDITERVQAVIEESGIRQGAVTVFAPHTTMGVVLNHNESMLLRDFTRILFKLVPIDDQYGHDMFELRRDAKSDGRSNGHSHCKAMLIGGSKTIPVDQGKMLISKLQSIFAVEFDGSRNRDVVVQVIGN